MNGLVALMNGTTCVDTNECAVENGGCEHNCIDTVGSYRCSCNPGYELQADGQGCQDVDECERTDIIDGCEGGCVNTVGGYYCSCPDNRQLNPSIVPVFSGIADESRCEGYPIDHQTRYTCTNPGNNFGIQTCSCKENSNRPALLAPNYSGCLGKELCVQHIACIALMYPYIFS